MLPFDSTGQRVVLGGRKAWSNVRWALHSALGPDQPSASPTGFPSQCTGHVPPRAWSLQPRQEQGRECPQWPVQPAIAQADPNQSASDTRPLSSTAVHGMQWGQVQTAGPWYPKFGRRLPRRCCTTDYQPLLSLMSGQMDQRWRVCKGQEPGQRFGRLCTTTPAGLHLCLAVSTPPETSELEGTSRYKGNLFLWLIVSTLAIC